MDFSKLIKKTNRLKIDKILKSGNSNGKLMLVNGDEGVGKTGIIVQLAIDHILLGEQVIHISFAKATDHLISWYESLTNINHINDWYDSISYELAEIGKLDKHEFRDEIAKSRIILNFSQLQAKSSKVIAGIDAVRSNIFPNVKVLIIDSYNFSISDLNELMALKEYSISSDIEIWLTTNNKEDKKIYENTDIFDEIISIIPVNNTMTVHLNNGKKVGIKLDPKSFLLKKI